MFESAAIVVSGAIASGLAYYHYQKKTIEDRSSTELNASNRVKSITIFDWSEDFNIGSLKQGELTIVVSENGVLIGKTIKITKELEFMLCSLMMKDIMSDVSTNDIYLDLSSICICEWSRQEQRQFITASDVNILLDYLVNNFDLDTYYRKEHILGLLTTHLCDISLGPLRCLELSSKRESSEYIRNLSLFDSGAIDTLFFETIDDQKIYENKYSTFGTNSPGVYPIYAMTIVIGGIRVIHTIIIGKGIPLFRIGRNLKYNEDVFWERLNLTDEREDTMLYEDNIRSKLVLSSCTDTKFGEGLIYRNIPLYPEIHEEGVDIRGNFYSCNRGNSYLPNRRRNSWYSENQSKCCYVATRTIEERISIKEKHGLCQCYIDIREVNQSSWDLDLSDDNSVRIIQNLSQGSYRTLVFSDIG